MDNGFWFEVGALIPSIGVGLLFWYVIRALLNADRSEREAIRQAEQEYARSHPTQPEPQQRAQANTERADASDVKRSTPAG